MKLKINNKLIHVPYKGAGQALTDVVGGQVDFYFPGLIAAIPFMQAGKLKVLAVATTLPIPRPSRYPDRCRSHRDHGFQLHIVGRFLRGRMPCQSNSATRLNDEIN